MTRRIKPAGALLLAIGCGAVLPVSAPALAAPPRQTAPPTAPPRRAVQPPAPAPRSTPCVVVTTAYGSVQTIEHDQVIRTGSGDVIHAGKGDRIISGPPKLVVLAVDVRTGATTPRVEAPLGAGGAFVEGAAIRGDELALVLRDDNGDQVYARVDLAARTSEVGLRSTPAEEAGRGGVLASDGVAYYRSCRRDYASYLCRGEDWEVRGVRTKLQGTDAFNAIAFSGGELYGIDSASVHVIDPGSGRAIRRFTPQETFNEQLGAGVVGDELVIVRGRDSLIRFDRKTGAVRGIHRVALPETASELHLACAADPGGKRDSRPPAR